MDCDEIDEVVELFYACDNNYDSQFLKKIEQSVMDEMDDQSTDDDDQSIDDKSLNT